MSDEASTTGAGTDGSAPSATPSTPDTTPVTPEASAPITTVEQLPEFAQKMISDLRAEAAAHRVKGNDAVKAKETELTQAFEAKLAESNTAHEATKAELGRANLILEKLEATLNLKVPTEQVVSFAQLLQGSNAEEIQAHAQQVLKTFTGLGGSLGRSSAVDPTQSLSGGNANQGGGDFASYIVGMLDKN
jgi:hypothetical protein